MRRWLIDVPTRVHLWCAEQELRRVDPSTVPSTLREARLRNLDRLREYRRARRFPRNTSSVPFTPVFIDAERRRCAVAHLMYESGHGGPAERVAKDANYHRLARMDFPELDAWAAGSGLSKAELARVQPAYGYGYVVTWTGWPVFAALLFVLIPIGAATILGNLVGLARRFRWRRVPVLSTIVGAVMLPAAVLAVLVFGGAYWEYVMESLAMGCNSMEGACRIEVAAPPISATLWTFALGAVCLVVGLVRFIRGRRYA